jgi:hypothetical protein
VSAERALRIAVVGLASYRVARLVAIDDIGAGLRQRIEREAAEERAPRWAADLVNCQHCVGAWSALGLGLGSGLGVLDAVAAAGLQSYLASRFHAS